MSAHEHEQTAALLEVVASSPNRDAVAKWYAAAIDTPGVDWAAVNKEIIYRWSLSGLRYIKKAAWKARGDAS